MIPPSFVKYEKIQRQLIEASGKRAPSFVRQAIQFEIGNSEIERARFDYRFSSSFMPKTSILKY
jgi:hypothetical protein